MISDAPLYIRILIMNLLCKAIQYRFPCIGIRCSRPSIIQGNTYRISGFLGFHTIIKNPECCCIAIHIGIEVQTSAVVPCTAGIDLISQDPVGYIAIALSKDFSQVHKKCFKCFTSFFHIHLRYSMHVPKFLLPDQSDNLFPVYSLTAGHRYCHLRCSTVSIHILLISTI